MSAVRSAATSPSAVRVTSLRKQLKRNVWHRTPEKERRREQREKQQGSPKLEEQEVLHGGADTHTGV